MHKDLTNRIKIREFTQQFNSHFYQQVTKVLIEEKVTRVVKRAGSPRTECIMNAKKGLNKHLEHLSAALQGTSYLVSDKISCADIAASCHISVVDYFGEMNWVRWPEIKNWYCLVKSRPGFQEILKDALPGFRPPQHYTSLDF